MTSYVSLQHPRHINIPLLAQALFSSSYYFLRISELRLEISRDVPNNILRNHVSRCPPAPPSSALCRDTLASLLEAALVVATAAGNKVKGFKTVKTSILTTHRPTTPSAAATNANHATRKLTRGQSTRWIWTLNICIRIGNTTKLLEATASVELVATKGVEPWRKRSRKGCCNFG